MLAMRMIAISDIMRKTINETTMPLSVPIKYHHIAFVMS